jgi:hypothetical protein
VTDWTADELTIIGSTDEVDIATRRNDGTLRRARIVWTVRHGDAVYVRSVNGTGAGWYRGAQTRHEGHLTAGTLDRDVLLVESDHTPGNPLDQALDAAYRAKYGRWAGPVARITSEQARSTTLRLEPA